MHWTAKRKIAWIVGGGGIFVDHSTIVVGGGLLGAAIAYGLDRPALPDETADFRTERVDVPNSAAA